MTNDEVSSIIDEARRLGLHLSVVGDKISIKPADKCPPDFVQRLKANKAVLLDHLRASGLAYDEVPWGHIARQILSGEFDGCTDSMRTSLEIGLRNIRHPRCQQALKRLRGEG